MCVLYHCVLSKLTLHQNKSVTAVWQIIVQHKHLRKHNCPFQTFKKLPNTKDIASTISKKSIVFRSDKEMDSFEEVMLRTHSLNSSLKIEGQWSLCFNSAKTYIFIDSTSSSPGVICGIRVDDVVKEGKKKLPEQRAWFIEPFHVTQKKEWDLSRICGVAASTLDQGYANTTTSLQYSTGSHYSPLTFGTGHTISHSVLNSEGRLVIALPPSPATHSAALPSNFEVAELNWHFVILEQGDTVYVSCLS